MQTNDQGPPSTAQEKPSGAAGGSVCDQGRQYIGADAARVERIIRDQADQIIKLRKNLQLAIHELEGCGVPFEDIQEFRDIADDRGME